MASDDDSEKVVVTKLDSTPPRLTEKDRKIRKSELERNFRVEVRSLKAYFSPFVYCLFR